MVIDLSLERVIEVAGRLSLLNPRAYVITVAGTNGKGSCVAGLEAIYIAAGYRVGAFTSPFLFRYNEQVRIQGEAADDTVFTEAFAQIKKACGDDVKPTPFELTALAAFYIFQQSHLDIWILEVGLGGRWDAVNALDADVALVTSIGIDHVEWLGNTRELIAREKAGIFRKDSPAVCGDFDPPLSLLNYANEINAKLFCQNKDFGFKKENKCWSWWSEKNKYNNLPLPKLALQNMSTVLMAVELSQNKLFVPENIIKAALEKVNLPGRIEVIPGDIIRIFDVSHNPASAKWLADYLQENKSSGKTHAVFSMLADKDIVGTIDIIKNQITDWHIAKLPAERAVSLMDLQAAFLKASVTSVTAYASIGEAYQAAMNISQPGDRVVAFGSFGVVAGVCYNEV